MLYKALDQIELVDMPTSLQPQTRSGLVLQSPRDPAPPVTLQLSMTSDQPQQLAYVRKATDEGSLKYFPRREISATKTFPPGCGRNAQCISTDDHLKSVFSEKGNSVGRERITLVPRPFEKPLMVVGKYASALSEKKYKTEISGGLTTKMKAPPKGKVAYLDPSLVISMHKDNNKGRRKKVQDGKQVAIYNSSCTTVVNAEKRKLMAEGKSVSASSEKKHKTENSGGSSTKMKVPPKGKVAYLDPGLLVSMHKDNNEGCDKENVNVINGCKAIVSHHKGIETLNLFRSILKEEKKKSKEEGNSSNRIDMLAFDRLKRIGMWVNSGKAILGSIPGVEVGYKFEYRVELSIVGLHRPFRSGIDYLNEGGKMIATSIVASGGYDNDMSDYDVLVYSGQGGKPMKGGDKRPTDQKLKQGNLALKNSIGEKNVVRVILGSNEVDSDSINARGKIVTYFVYIGFYLVEKYWKQTGDSGNSIFMFQLRRVPGQSKLHLGKNYKKHTCT